MSDISVTIITGNLGNDAEIKYTNAGDSILTFSVAVNTPTKVNGQWDKHTSWYHVSKFVTEKELSFLQPLLTKGSKVTVEGPMIQNKKDDRTYWNLKAKNIIPEYKKSEDIY